MDIKGPDGGMVQEPAEVAKLHRDRYVQLGKEKEADTPTTIANDAFRDRYFAPMN